MKYFTKEIQIALVAIVGLVLLFYGLQFLKGKSLISNASTYYIALDDVTGMSASSPIYVNGYKVGIVEDIIYNYATNGKIIAAVGLDKGVRLPVGTTAAMTSDMLGNVRLKLFVPETADGYIQPGDTLRGAQQVGLMDKAGEMLPQVEGLLPKLDSILSSVNALLADPALQNSLRHVEQITASLEQTTGELRQLSSSLNKNVPSLMSKADGVMDHTEKLTRNLSEVEIAQTMDKVNATLENVQQMTSKLNSMEGTLGLLMRDPGLYNHLNATMRDADSLMIDLKRHPKRYVHFSVFGKKDK